MNEGIVPGTLAASSAPRSSAVLTGEKGEFRRLVTRGALLELVTFGFYRFWLATNIRRHLWSNSSVAGDALEYTMLIGMLDKRLRVCYRLKHGYNLPNEPSEVSTRLSR